MARGKKATRTELLTKKLKEVDKKIEDKKSYNCCFEGTESAIRK